MLALPRAGHSQLPCFWCSSGCQFSRTAVNLSTSSSGGSGKLPFCGLLVGGWALPHVPFQVLWIGIPIPLKNDGVSNSWDDFPFPTERKVMSSSHVPVTTNQSSADGIWLDSKHHLDSTPKITHPFDVKVIFGVVKRDQNQDKNESEHENNQNVSPS